MPPQSRTPIPTPAPDSVATAPLLAPTLAPVELAQIRTIADIPNVLATMREATDAIRLQMAADVRAAEVNGPTDGKHANLAAAVITLTRCVDTLAQINA